jgi:hypothetical protein
MKRRHLHKNKLLWKNEKPNVGNDKLIKDIDTICYNSGSLRQLIEDIDTICYNSGSLWLVGITCGKVVGHVNINDIAGCRKVPELVKKLAKDSGKASIRISDTSNLIKRGE